MHHGAMSQKKVTAPPSNLINDAMERRRVALRKRWRQVAQEAGTTTETLRQIRAGLQNPGPLTRGGIDKALLWAPGQGIDALLEGRQPIELDPPPLDDAELQALEDASPDDEISIRSALMRLDAAEREIDHARAILHELANG